MEKVIFENLPSTNSAISASNLMKMQDNIETAIKLPNWGNTEDLTDYKGDLDELTVSGFYVTNEDTPNIPTEGGCYYVLVMTKTHGYYTKQVAFDRESNAMYHRTKHEGNWTPWKCVSNNYVVKTLDSDFDNVFNIIGTDYKDRTPYVITNEPAGDVQDNYIQDGTSHTIHGMEYGNQQYGYQVSFGMQGVKWRRKWAGVWDTWISLM